MLLRESKSDATLPGMPLPYPQPVEVTERIRRRVGWECQCARCGAIFPASRRDARACSPACARALSRARRRAPKSPS